MAGHMPNYCMERMTREIKAAIKAGTLHVTQPDSQRVTRASNECQQDACVQLCQLTDYARL